MNLRFAHKQLLAAQGSINIDGYRIIAIVVNVVANQFTMEKV